MLLGKKRRPCVGLAKLQFAAERPTAVWVSLAMVRPEKRFFTATRVIQRPPASEEELQAMSITQLREELRSRKMKMSGTKGELLQRLGCAPKVDAAAREATTPKSRPERPHLRVVIAEKPLVAKAIAKVLGVNVERSGYIGEVELGSGGTIFFPGNVTTGDFTVITWAGNQLLEWKEDSFSWSLDKLPIIPSHFELTYSRDPSLRKQFETIKRLLRHADEIVNACDAGKEGELMFRMIKEKVASPHASFKRLWINSLTDEAIKEGFQDLQPLNKFDPLYLSALARKEADWLVGINATQVYTMVYKKKVAELGDDDLVSVGRVQTPILRLIVDRANAIKDFKKKPYWKIRLLCRSLKQGKEEVYLEYFDPTNEDSHKERIYSKEEADEIVSQLLTECKVRSYANKERLEPPPKLYDLTSLQKDAHRWHDITAQQTLQALIKLYDTHKFITYPRTSSRYLPPSLYKRIGIIMRVLSTHNSFKDAYAEVKSEENEARFNVNNSAIFDAEKTLYHHAIIPTLPLPSFEELSETLSSTELHIYEMIVARLFASFMPDCKKLDTRLVVVNNDKYYFKGTKTSVVRAGWKTIYEYLAHGDDEDEEEEEEQEEKKAPTELQFDDKLLYEQVFEPEEEGTEEEDVDAVMFATKIPTWKEKPRKGDTFKCELPAPIMSGTTKPPPYLSEAALLHLIETAGKVPTSEEEREALQDSGLGTASTRAAAVDRLIEVGYVERDGKKLKATSKGKALVGLLSSSALASVQSTSEWEKRIQDIMTDKEDREDFLQDIKEYTKKMVASAKEGGESMPDIPKMRRKFTSKKFLEGAAQAASKMFEDKEAAEELDAPCWKCKTGKVVTKPQWRSWRCDNKDANCDFVLYKTSCGRALEKNELTKLLSDGVTSVLSGFTSKAGKKFAARLALNEKNQVMFVFPERFTNSEEGGMGTSSDE